MLVDGGGCFFQKLFIEVVERRGACAVSVCAIFACGCRHCLLAVQLAHFLSRVEQTVHAGDYDLHIKGFGNVDIGAGGVAFYLVGVRLAGGEQDDGDMTGALVRFDGAAEFQAAEVWHHDVADDEVGDELDGLCETLGAVRCCGGAECFWQFAADIFAEMGVVFDEEDEGSIVVFRIFRRFGRFRYFECGFGR